MYDNLEAEYEIPLTATINETTGMLLYSLFCLYL